MLIMAAPTGARKTKADHPKLAMTVPETVATAQACYAAGAQALHLHIRDGRGDHSIDPGLYREAMVELARAIPEMRIQTTTEAVGVFDVQAQRTMIQDLRPAWTTLALREAARDDAIAREIYGFCQAEGIKLQHIIFDAADARLLANWQDAGVLDEAASVILVLGRYAADMNSNPIHLEPLLASLPPVGDWMLCAFGPNEHACLQKAATLGGDLRVGFENSTQQADSTLWPDMAASVSALKARIAGPAHG